MIIHSTKKLLDAIPFNISAEPSTEPDPLFSWHANLLVIDRRKTIVLMNDSNRYVVVLHGVKAKDFHRLDELIPEAIRQVLQAERVRDDVIEQYFQGAGAVSFQKTRSRSMTAQLKQACDYTWFYQMDLDPDTIVQVPVSMKASRFTVGGNHLPEFRPREELFRNLESLVDGEIFTNRALVMNITIALAGHSVWRRVLVPSDLTFRAFHDTLQILFDWRNSHLHEFYLYMAENADHSQSKEPVLNIVMDEEAFAYPGDVEMRMEEGLKLSDFVPRIDYMKYMYDFGDGWEHHIFVEETLEDKPLRSPICLSGEGTAPPEDCGGESGFDEFLKAMHDPENSEHESVQQWAKWQLYREFDLEFVNGRLGRM